LFLQIQFAVDCGPSTVDIVIIPLNFSAAEVNKYSHS
jgi:hypothetical protein